MRISSGIAVHNIENNKNTPGLLVGNIFIGKSADCDKIDKAEEGQKKTVFGSPMEYKGGKWVPAEGGGTEEEDYDVVPDAVLSAISDSGYDAEEFVNAAVAAGYNKGSIQEIPPENLDDFAEEIGVSKLSDTDQALEEMLGERETLESGLQETPLEEDVEKSTPNAGETKNQFISRMMSHLHERFPDQKQRLAVAYSMWDRANKSVEKEDNDTPVDEYIDDANFYAETVEDEIPGEDIDMEPDILAISQSAGSMNITQINEILDKLLADKVIDKQMADTLTIDQINEIINHKSAIDEIIASLGGE